MLQWHLEFNRSICITYTSAMSPVRSPFLAVDHVSRPIDRGATRICVFGEGTGSIAKEGYIISHCAISRNIVESPRKFVKISIIKSYMGPSKMPMTCKDSVEKGHFLTSSCAHEVWR